MCEQTGSSSKHIFVPRAERFGRLAGSSLFSSRTLALPIGAGKRSDALAGVQTLSNGTTAAIPRGSIDEVSRAVDTGELIEGLMLVRASTIKVVRLQLAMERRDRRSALQAVDDLVDLDAKLGDFLNGIPGSASGTAQMQREIDEQRGWLAREKLTLAAGISIHTAMPDGRGWIEPPKSAANHESAGTGAPVGLRIEPPSSYISADIYEEEAPVRRVSKIWTWILLLLIVVVGGIIAAATGAWSDLITYIPLPQGAS